jgi:hypothetical protein
MKRFILAGASVGLATAAVAVMLSSCMGDRPEKPKSDSSSQKTTPKAAEAPAKEDKLDTLAEAEDAADAQKELNLGSPLVDDEKALVKLDPKLPVWVDKKNKQVIFLAAACRASYMLEFFATRREKSYESVVVTDARPSLIHAGLLAVGAKPGKPVQFTPEYVKPSGTQIDIEVRWKDKEGKVQKAPAQKWIRDSRTKKAADITWVFAGSLLRKNTETGETRYLADAGDFITVVNLPTAMLDVPIESEKTMEARSYEGFEGNMPPSGTPVTVVLVPKAAAGERSP